MKDILTNIGLSEVLAYLCPGTLLLGSALLWLKLPEGKMEGWSEFLLAVFLVILSYTLGLILSTWSSEGAAHYILASRSQRSTPSIAGFFFWLFHWLPDLLTPRNSSIVDAQTAIQEDLFNRSGLT